MEVYRILRVESVVKDEIVNVLELFGWKYRLATEETWNFGASVAKTDDCSYVSLLFVRDTEMKNYERLSQLEAEYRSGVTLKEYAKKTRKPILFSVLSAFFLELAIIAVYSLTTGVVPTVWEILFCVLIPAVFVPLLVFFWVRYIKKRKKEIAYNKEVSEYNNACSEAWEKRAQEIFDECSLLKE